MCGGVCGWAESEERKMKNENKTLNPSPVCNLLFDSGVCFLFLYSFPLCDPRGHFSNWSLQKPNVQLRSTGWFFSEFNFVRSFSIVWWNSTFDYRMFHYRRRDTTVVIHSPWWSRKQLTWSSSSGSQRNDILANPLQSVLLFWLTCFTELYLYAKKFVFSWPHT